jgi:hypothetical protein
VDFHSVQFAHFQRFSCNIAMQARKPLLSQLAGKVRVFLLEWKNFKKISRNFKKFQEISRKNVKWVN